MKTIGLIGGTGWVSTLDYYRIINQEINRMLGGLNSARCILYSLNYADIDANNKREDHRANYRLVVDAAAKLKNASANCLVLCANTMHQYADQLERDVKLPVIHIADSASHEINKKGLNTIGLLGTKFTMEMDFYKKHLDTAGINTIVPVEEDRQFIHDTIMGELLKEIVNPGSKQKFLHIIEGLENNGAQGIVLGCTEIPMLIKQADTHLPVFNTLELHAKAVAEFAVNG